MQNDKYKYIFGPVPSRRLGISLGLDLVPHKTCSLNCIYCECGPTTHLTTQRKQYVPTENVIAELNHFLKSKPKLDYITFSGSGEPTLHSGIGEITQYLKYNYSFYKIALLTNGTLFDQSSVRKQVNNIDLILPSLDAASDIIFHKVNRPFTKLKMNQVINGLIKLRSEYSGEMWLEIFVIPGLNDNKKEIKLLRQAIHNIKPNQVHLNTLDRPGTESWIKAAQKKELEHIALQLDWETRVIAHFQSRGKIPGYNTDIESSIIQTIMRRPCTTDDLSATLELHPNEINKYIKNLLERDLVKPVKMERGFFYKFVNSK